MNTRPVKLTADLIEAVAGTFLSPRYDNLRPTPAFHREVWALYASDLLQVGCVSPRDHGKSSAFTFAYIVAEAMFRSSDYIILVSSTEELATEQLSNIAEELRTNEDLISEFGIRDFESDTKADITVAMADGHRFRILARGAEQRIRGRLWKGKRPNLMVFDDVEDDEQVESRERRKKFRRWFFRAARQALSINGRVRVHGTVLHDDSLLSRLRKNKTWKFLFYKAHTSFGDFSNLLWPERWSEAQLRARRQEFIEDDDAPGYSQEFLNTPLDDTTAYLRRGDFKPMEEADHKTPKIVCAAADFAVSKSDLANRTSFSIGGKCVQNRIYFLDQRVGRWDTVEWIDEMFSIQEAWSPEVFFVEDGVIWKAVKRMVYNAMEEKDIFINIEAIPSVKDKATRGRPLQKRMRAGNCRFDKEAEWYPDFEDELLRFTGGSDALQDDQFDSAALLVSGLEHQGAVVEEDFETEEEQYLKRHDPRKQLGRNLTTGY